MVSDLQDKPGDLRAVPQKIAKKERRGQARIFIRRIITYKVPSPQQTRLSGNGKDRRGVLLNISSKGICLKTRHPLRGRMVLKINLPVTNPFLKAPTLGEVLWVRRDPVRKEYRAGVRYIL